MSSKARNKEKKEERRGAMYAEERDNRTFCNTSAMLRGYDKRKAELDAEQAYEDE